MSSNRNAPADWEGYDDNGGGDEIDLPYVDDWRWFFEGLRDVYVGADW